MWWAALTLGFLGSTHCIGMCGPIAMSLPGADRRWQSLALNGILYNSGRTLTYMALGLVFGLLGASVRLAGFQSYLSLLLGISLLVFAFINLNVESRFVKLPAINRAFGQLRIHLARLLKNHSKQNIFTIGLLNGFLPCGLVYAAIFGAISTGGILEGAAFMGLFGLGTFPLMLSLAVAGQWIGISTRKFIYKLIPAFLFIMGILLIIRGLNFDLPYDFRFWQAAAEQPMCH